MIDTRAVGQELQDHVVAAARKGHQRVTTTVKTVTATAAMIKPQLPSLPAIHTVKLPTPDQLREKAPELFAKLPTPDQVKAGAQELAGHFRTIQHQVVGQVRSVTGSLAHQASATFAQVTALTSAPKVPEATAKAATTETTVTETTTATVTEKPTAHPGQGTATQAKAARPAMTARPASKRVATPTRKPKSKPATK